MNPLTLRMISFQVLILLALAFGTLAWIARPEGAWIWALGMATLPLTWLGLHLFGAMPPEDRPETRRVILNSLNGAGLLIAGALGASALGVIGAIDESWITRYAMITNALVLVVIGNGLPKKIQPGCPRTRSLSLQRLIGWTFVVGGLLQALLWLLIPAPDEAGALLTFGVYATMAMIVAIGLWRIRGGEANGSPTT
jgi:hypothetical protein